MRVVVLHPYTKLEVRRPCRSKDMSHDVSALMGLVTVSFDILTLKLVYESHQRWGTFIDLATLDLRILELFAIYVTDGQTYGRTDGQKQSLLLLPYGRGHNNNVNVYPMK